jgi:hypothetical protein
MIFEKNAKTGELAVSKSFLFAVFDDLERVMMSSEVFFKWQRRLAFLPPFLIYPFNSMPHVGRHF